MLEHKTVKKIQAETEKYPEGRQQSAILYALNLVQHDNNGFLTTKLMDEVAELLEMPKVSVYEVYGYISQVVGHFSISVLLLSKLWGDIAVF